jgi:hypothetical protein
VKGINNGTSTFGIGISGYQNGSGWGVYGSTASLSGYAGYFQGNVFVSGTCCAMGEAYTRIDHPLDPENEYLNQSLVQSPDMISIVNGNATLDGNGETTASIPDWFQAANGDFRYTLTAVGAPGPNLYVAQELTGGSFKIAGGKPGGKVSWQVTGVRHDPFARAHPIQPETQKPAEDKGKYLHPAVYGQPESKGVNYDKTHSKP